VIGPREWWAYTDNVLKAAAKVRGGKPKRPRRQNIDEDKPQLRPHTLLALVVRRDKCAFALQVPRETGDPLIVVGRIVEGLVFGKQLSLRAGILELPDDCLVVGMLLEEGSRYTCDHHMELRAQLDDVAKLIDLPRPPKGSYLVGLGMSRGESAAIASELDVVVRANELTGLNLAPDQRLEAKAVGLLLYGRENSLPQPRRTRPMSARRQMQLAISAARTKIGGWDLRKLRER
jgi:hypothetical protein